MTLAHDAPAPTPGPATAAAERDRARRHLVPHFTKRDGWRRAEFPVLDRGEGVHVWDAEGRRYLDGLSGLFCTNLGHGRADLVAAATEQMSRLAFEPTWGLTHRSAIDAAEAIAGVTPAGLDDVFFVSSGSEAVESAVKLARSYHLARGEAQRTKVIARQWAYHGTTLGALAVTGVPRMRAPFMPLLFDGVRHVHNTLGCHDTPAAEVPSLACVRAVEEAIIAEGPETVSMVIAEPVQNGGGALVPPDGYWAALRSICDRHGILLCADEVICGFGRLGHWFGSDRVGGAPDLLTFAKGATSGYAPLGGVVLRHEVTAAVEASPMGGFVHGSTFGGHPLATAVAAATVRAMADEGVVDHVAALEPHLAGGMQRLLAAHDSVGDVRGCGFFHATQLVGSRSAGRPLTDQQSAELLGGLLTRWVWDEGLLIRADDRGATMLVVAPPLVSTREELDDLLARLDKVLTRVDAFVAR
jgi:adenosylmethionine-8-amino-7-oxononanoate aminotransferase